MRCCETSLCFSLRCVCWWSWFGLCSCSSFSCRSDPPIIRFIKASVSIARLQLFQVFFHGKHLLNVLKKFWIDSPAVNFLWAMTLCKFWQLYSSYTFFEEYWFILLENTCSVDLWGDRLHTNEKTLENTIVTHLMHVTLELNRLSVFVRKWREERICCSDEPTFIFHWNTKAEITVFI